MPEDDCLIGRRIDDGALKTDSGGWATEDSIDSAIEIDQNRLPSCRRGSPRAIGARGDDRPTDASNQIERYGVLRHPDRYSIKPCGQIIGQIPIFVHDERQRPWPKSLHEKFRQRRYFSYKLRELFERSDMGDQGVIRRATFGFKDPLYSGWIEGIGSQSIHSFRWKRDQLSVDQQIRCRLDLLDRYALRSSHRRIAL